MNKQIQQLSKDSGTPFGPFGLSITLARLGMRRGFPCNDCQHILLKKDTKTMLQVLQ